MEVQQLFRRFEEYKVHAKAEPIVAPREFENIHPRHDARMRPSMTALSSHASRINPLPRAEYQNAKEELPSAAKLTSTISLA